MKEIIKAEPCGFCMGVRRAIDLVEKEIGQGEDLFTLGPIIHNRQVQENLASRGVRLADIPEDVSEGSSLVIRAHGVEPELEERLMSRGVKIIDGTCPKVKSSHRTIEEYSGNGYFVVILGDKNHGEVKGLAGRADRHAVVSTASEAEKLTLPEKTLFICQTTVKDSEFEEVRDILLTKNPHTVIRNMICAATMKRQKAVRELSTQVEAMVIVGGRGSSNTKRLYQTALENDIFACHVETADELPPELHKFSRIGVSAGASTPDDIIDEVMERLRSL